MRKPVYDRYLSINRHQNGPGSWIHWRDNTKMGSHDAKLVPIVQEYRSHRPIFVEMAQTAELNPFCL